MKNKSSDESVFYWSAIYRYTEQGVMYRDKPRTCTEVLLRQPYRQCQITWSSEMMVQSSTIIIQYH